MNGMDATNVTAPSNASSPLVAGFALTRSDRRVLIYALLGLLAVRLLAIAWIPFTDTTEARYAEIARKMLETGDWITPQFDYGVPFWGKPPLHTWLSATGMAIFGVGHFGARVFILLAAFGVLTLAYMAMRAQRGADQALVAVVVIASSLLFFGASAFVMTDMAMALGTTLSMVGFFLALQPTPHARVWGYAFFVGLAVGLLAKGPVAVVLTGLPIGLWVIIGNRWRQLGALPWVGGIVLLLVLALPWYVAAELKTPGFLRYFIIGEHYERFVVSGWQGDLYGTGHAKPKGMIWIYGAIVFLPWTLFALALIARPKGGANTRARDDNGWISYLLLWSISPLLVFTVAANILAAYALPGVPAAGLLLTSLWASRRGAPGRRTRLAVGIALMGVLVLFTVLAGLARFAPDALNLRAEDRVVAASARIDPDMRLNYWKNRSYSAEFYTRGKVRVVTTPDELDQIRTDRCRDAIAVDKKDVDAIFKLQSAGFLIEEEFARRLLLAEPPIEGASTCRQSR